MAAAIFVVESYWTRSTFRIASGANQMGAFPRETQQESWEIYTLWLELTGVPYKWIAPLQ